MLKNFLLFLFLHLSLILNIVILIEPVFLDLNLVSQDLNKVDEYELRVFKSNFERIEGVNPIYQTINKVKIYVWRVFRVFIGWGLFFLEWD